MQHEFLSEAIFKWVSKGLHLFCFTTLGNWSRKFSPYDNKSYAKLTLITNKSPVFIVCLFQLRVLILRYFPVFWLAYMITMVFVIRHSIVHSGTVSCTSRVFLLKQLYPLYLGVNVFSTVARRARKGAWRCTLRSWKTPDQNRNWKGKIVNHREKKRIENSQRNALT